MNEKIPATEKVAEEIKKSLNGYNKSKMYAKMYKHYKTLRLIDNKDKWVLPELEKISNELLPKDLSEEKSKAFVDEMAKLTENNPYLVNFLEKAQNEKFPQFENKVKTEGEKVFPELVALSFVFEKLTKAFYTDHKLLEKCLDVFTEERSKSGIFKEMGLFHKVKFTTVENPLKNVYLKSKNLESVPKNAMVGILSLNILEATIADYIKGYYKNGRAGWTLTVNRPTAKTDPRTGAEPAKWNKERKTIEASLPLPKKWNDLYQTWNMAFVSQAETNVYIMPKLLIPIVADYKKTPKEYMFRRVIALYIYLNYSEFDVLDRKISKKPYIDWSDSKLTNFWGKENAKCAKDYETCLRDAKKGKALNKDSNKDRKLDANKVREKMLVSKSVSKTNSLDMN